MVEECEVRAKQTALRTGRENLALVHLGNGLELLRVGPATSRDVAGWRYEHRLRQRNKRFMMRWSVAILLVVSLAVVRILIGVRAEFGGVATVIVLVVIMMAGAYFRLWVSHDLARDRQVIMQVHLESGEVGTITGQDLGSLRITSTRDPPYWALAVTYDKGSSCLAGAEATWLLEKAMAWINQEGGNRREVSEALNLLEAAGSAPEYLARAGVEMDGLRVSVTGIPELPATIRLALEMAAHDLGEREEAAQELEELKGKWWQAEQEASISDELLLTPEIQSWLERLRR